MITFIIAIFFFFEAIDSYKENKVSKLEESYFFALNCDQIEKVVIKNNSNEIVLIEKDEIEKFLKATRDFRRIIPNHPLTKNQFFVEIFILERKNNISFRVSIQQIKEALILSDFGFYSSNNMYEYFESLLLVSETRPAKNLSEMSNTFK